MNRKKITNTNFQTFFVSKEQSICPQISDIVRSGKKLKEKGLPGDVTGFISLSYGKRILINGKNTKLMDVKKRDIIEIVDYDPIKNIFLAIGQKEPSIETPIHWLIHHAREDVNAVIQLNDENIVEKLTKKLPVIEKEYPSGSLEQAKEVLKTLRTGKNIVMKNKGVLFVGTSLKEAEDSALTSIGD
jgi:ribulose-5-phosphate 4-epimerase/fuculose-1-phosphate aldolase